MWDFDITEHARECVEDAVMEPFYLFLLSNLILSYHTFNLSSYFRSYLILPHECQEMQHSTADTCPTHVFNIAD